MTLIAFPTARNLLSVARYGQIMRLDLPHLMQVGGTSYPRRTACQHCWTEEMRWQLRSTIAQAEQMIADQVGYSVAPAYFDEWHRFPARMRNSSRGLWGFRYQFGIQGWPELRTAWKRVLTLGSIELDEITPDSWAWSCPDADAVDQLGTITIADATAALNINRIRVFFDDPRLEIRGLRIRRVGDNIIIDGDRPVWVLPDACTLGDDCVEWDTDGNFVSQLGHLYVAEEVDHPEDAVCLEWTTNECGETCTTTTQRGCPNIADGELGRIKALPGAWDGTTLTVGSPTYCYPPNRYRLRYGRVGPMRMPGCGTTTAIRWQSTGSER